MKSLFRPLAGLLVLWFYAVAAVAAAQVSVPRIDHETYRLPNGLNVILVEDKRLPLVAVNIWYHVGPANEKPGRTGFAHLFEHMMFQGSKNVAEEQHFRILEGAGASQINGTTSFDRTNYFETVPSNQLELALWIESDRMGFLLETLDQAKLTNQQDVVRNERRQSVENRPYGLVDEALFHTLFPKGHPYYASIIGSHADIEAARLGDVREFFRQYYSPGNASLAIVGDIDRKAVKALVARYFGSLPAGPAVEKLNVVQPRIDAERRVVVTDRIELPRVTMAWHTPALFAPGDADADLAATVLGGGKTSRLYRKLVYELQIAQSVQASQQSMQLGSVFQIEATARQGVTVEQLEQAIEAELTKLAAEGPTADELEQARNYVLTGMLQSLETGMGIAERLNSYQHFLGRTDFLQQDLDRYQKVDVATVRSFVQTALRRQARVVLHAVPGDKKIDDVPRTAERAPEPPPQKTAADWRATAPKAGPTPRFTLPVPKRFTLPNGLTVMLLEQHRLPVLSANLVVLAGSDRNPAGKAGLASFTADMLDEGTLTRSSAKLAEDLAALGATLSSGSSTDNAAVSLYSLSRNADPAFALLADVVRNPAFDPAEIERVRRSRLTQLVQQRENPTAVAQRAFNRALYGEHPYGFTELGTQASVQALGADDLRAFWKAAYQPGNAALVVAGDITEAQVRVLLARHLGSWAGSSERLAPPVPTQSEQSKVIVIDKPGAPQSALRIGQVGVARASPDYVPLSVMNNVLGGMFSSRINLNLRERNGYAYGASSGFAFRRGPGPFVAASSVRTDATAPAVREIFSELRGIRESTVTADELQLSRDSLSRSLPGLFETTGSMAGSSAQLFVHGLPVDYYRSLPQAIQGVTAADVQRVARQYLQPERMVSVVVGDRAKVEESLKALGVGPVEVRPAD